MMISITNIMNCCADDYPQSRQEREVEEMDSFLGGEGLTFRPGRIKNETTKSGSTSVNKFLWQASIEMINFAPLSSVDSAGGVIITDWYSPKNKPTYSFKINIFIKDDIISPDAIEVKIFERVLKNNNWLQEDKISDTAMILEKKILNRARDLYIQSGRK